MLPIWSHGRTEDPERLLPALGRRLVLDSGVRCRGTGRTRKSSSRRARSRSSAGRSSVTASSSGSRGVSEILLRARQLVSADICGVEFCVMGKRAERRYVRGAITTYGGEASEEALPRYLISLRVKVLIGPSSLALWPHLS